jgi:hypothetical protein
MRFNFVGLMTNFTSSIHDPILNATLACAYVLMLCEYLWFFFVERMSKFRNHHSINSCKCMFSDHRFNFDVISLLGCHFPVG